MRMANGEREGQGSEGQRGLVLMKSFGGRVLESSTSRLNINSNNSFVEHLLHARHSAQHVMCVFLLKPSHCFMRHCYYLGITYRKGAEAQRQERYHSQ